VQRRLVCPLFQILVGIDHKLEAAEDLWRQWHHLRAVAQAERAALFLHDGLGYAQLRLPAHQGGRPGQGLRGQQDRGHDELVDEVLDRVQRGAHQLDKVQREPAGLRRRHCLRAARQGQRDLRQGQGGQDVRLLPRRVQPKRVASAAVARGESRIPQSGEQGRRDGVHLRRRVEWCARLPRGAPLQQVPRHVAQVAPVPGSQPKRDAWLLQAALQGREAATGEGRAAGGRAAGTRAHGPQTQAGRATRARGSQDPRRGVQGTSRPRAHRAAPPSAKGPGRIPG